MTAGRHALPSPLRKVYTEVAKFGLVGLSGIAVNILVFNTVRYVTDMQTVRASVVATAVAILSNYIGFRYFTYRDRKGGSRRRELTLFALFSAIGLLIENGVLFAATYGLGLDSALLNNFFKFVGIGVATLFRFWSYRTWVFKAVPDASADAPVPVGAVHGVFTDVAHGVLDDAETMALRTVPEAAVARPRVPEPRSGTESARTAPRPVPRPSPQPAPRPAQPGRVPSAPHPPSDGPAAPRALPAGQRGTR